MNTNPDRKPWDDAVDQLIEAVNEAPLEGFRSILEEQSKLKKWENSRGLSRALDDLKQFALLGYPDAVELLVIIAEDISSFLEELMPLSERRDGQSEDTKASSSQQKPQDAPTPADWQSKLDQAADRLHKAITEHYQSCMTDIEQRQEKLPVAHFSFPLEILVGRSAPPDPPLKLASDICDRLIQKRFNSEIGESLFTLTTHAWFWPVVISAGHYKANRGLKDCTPELHLGEAIPVNINSGEDATPKAIATGLFQVLEQERLIPRSESELEEWRRDEEDNVPAFDTLIREALKQRGRIRYTLGWNIYNIWRRKAALLPPLRKDSVSQWADAAYAKVISDYGGDLKKLDKIETIKNKIVSLGTVNSALKRVLKQGFESMARDDTPQED